jgi:C1q-related factor
LTGVETAVGVVDVKSSPVYFHVQRNSPYYATGTTIPFEIERLNVGGGMNINSGIFTAPKSGIYFFSFSAVKEGPATAGMFVDLYLNSINIARAFGFAAFGHFTASLSSTLSLKSGDRISLLLAVGQLYDSTACYTNFNGILLQEEI